MYSIVASGSNIVVTDIRNPNPAGQSTVATVPSSSRDLTWVYSEDNTVTLIVDGVMCTPAKFGQIFVAGTACTSKADFESRVAALTSSATPVSAAGVQPKVYRALLTQTGTNAPVATVLENTIGDIVWARADVGWYTATLTNAFTLNKTAFFATNGEGSNLFKALYSDVSQLAIQQYNAGIDDLADDFAKSYIEILVYP